MLKIDSAQVASLPLETAKQKNSSEASCGACQPTQSEKAAELDRRRQEFDRVTLGESTASARLENDRYTMADIKKRANEVTKSNSEKESAEAIPHMNDVDRDERVHIAQLRVQSGFYNRPDVLDEIVNKLVDGVQ